MLGVNQQTLADLASVAVSTVVAIERGEGNPQLSTLLMMLDTLGLQKVLKNWCHGTVRNRLYMRELRHGAPAWPGVRPGT